MKPLLCVRHHMPHALGVGAEVMVESGVPIRYLDAWREDAWPELSEVSGLAVLGGEMHAHQDDRYPFLARERDLLVEAVERDVPVMGICLGAQLLAGALGAEVERSPVPELGFHPVTATEAGRDDPVLSPFASAPRVFQWHVDTFGLPPEAVLLYSSPGVPHQAFRVGSSAYGVQFHLEATDEGIDAWCVHWERELVDAWRRTREDILEEVREFLPAQRKAAREAFGAFADLLAGRP